MLSYSLTFTKACRFYLIAKQTEIKPFIYSLNTVFGLRFYSNLKICELVVFGQKQALTGKRLLILTMMDHNYNKISLGTCNLYCGQAFSFVIFCNII